MLGDCQTTRTDAAFGGWCEACGAKLASLTFQGASPLCLAAVADLTEKKSEAENFSSMKKIRKKIAKFFSSIFRKFFP